jgi:hypothetical protein
MSEIMPEMVEVFAGMSAEEIFAGMMAAGVVDQFADPWLVASYLSHLGAGQ